MADQFGNHDRFVRYDPESDILRLPTGPLADMSGERTEWGVVARDTRTGAVILIEIWAASERVPKDILDAVSESVDPDPSA
ncbi:MAG: DUF2283 domain-containing protein [Solirubrobacterales bacterium]